MNKILAYLFLFFTLFSCNQNANDPIKEQYIQDSIVLNENIKLAADFKKHTELAETKIKERDFTGAVAEFTKVLDFPVEVKAKMNYYVHRASAYYSLGTSYYKEACKDATLYLELVNIYSNWNAETTQTAKFVQSKTCGE
ncbi:MAG: hypothetical protein V4556_11235 [Bacteroidota bacterium]